MYYAADATGSSARATRAISPPTNGRVLQGPPPRPLPRVRLEQRGDELVAVGMSQEGDEAGWNPLARRRRRCAIDAAMGCVILVLIVQMWLLTATLESYLAGHRSVAGIAFAVSISLFLLCGALYALVARLDRSRGSGEPPRSSAGPWRMGQS